MGISGYTRIKLMVCTGFPGSLILSSASAKQKRFVRQNLEVLLMPQNCVSKQSSMKMSDEVVALMSPMW